MPALWVRVSPAVLDVLALPPGGRLVMMVAAKKHLTIFKRERKCRRPPGRLEVKNTFREAAKKTRAMKKRADRNVVIKAEVERAAVKTGVYKRVSRSKYAPLAGTVYEVKGDWKHPPTSYVT